eukprot:CAMPEP_0179089226 /NCGR_PEP_ID=MMETSP0796-20121207/40643_1 /TAXON_ID=73915 /ORGANISM="Pyrodinium bahamense, Strain pbaha01" /LENGTH=145 /DNA_ID=CAMNT_0020786775 /DNA_START=35 /DNA_END=472 /DNA_ORIENTATION=+
MASLTQQQKSRLVLALHAGGLVDIGEGRHSSGYKVFMDAFDKLDTMLEDANKAAENREVAGVPRVELLKMLWVVEQATNPGKQPSLVRLPSGLTIQRQSSNVSLARSTSAKWEDRVLQVVKDVRYPSASCLGCCDGCFSGYQRLA